MERQGRRKEFLTVSGTNQLNVVNGEKSITYSKTGKA
jgi:hypothetical protein